MFVVKIRKHIEDAFQKARQEPVSGLYSSEPVLELVGQIAEPQEPRARRVQYSSQEVYHVPEPQPESLDLLYARAVKSLIY